MIHRWTRRSAVAVGGIIERILVSVKCAFVFAESTSRRIGAFVRIKFDVPQFCEHE